ncbi:hypothetical protein [Streptomyces aureoversilis]|uniref:Uncharacterized protein n=1 Tax=Streptomyces aureoversilis TaxID=67277 RepID=A0ABW0A3E5_9ACTN
MIEQVEALARPLSVLEHHRLQHQANAVLGQAVSLAHGFWVRWASVYVHVLPQDLGALLDAQRRQLAAKLADETERLRIERIISFRNSLREDPTLALAQMLLESPAAVTPSTFDTMESIASRVAAYAPGAKAVAVAQLLRDFTAELKPDAKQFIADRLCTVLVEFGGTAEAEELRAILRADS